jgi:hypothetical protein
MKRKLASIQKILSLERIEGADRIEKATVLGWEVVVKKDDFKVGDLVVYCEVDSVLPQTKYFEFMKERNYRVRTIKLKKQVSQGLCCPISILPKGKYTEYDDVTEILGVTKYETEYEKNERLQQEIKSNKIKKFFMKYNWFRRLFASDRMCWPSFIPKTDEPRIQLFPHICEQEKDTEFSVTEKLDGQSATYFLVKNPKRWQFWKPYIFGVCSRNFLKGKKDNSTWWKIAGQYQIELLLKSFLYSNKNHKYIVIQGEILGEGVQKNKYNIKGLDFYIFNVFTDIRENSNSFINSFCNGYNLKQVPKIMDYFKLQNSIPEVVEFSKRKSDIADIPREGIVVRNYEKNISFKVINPDFLLKYNE